MLDFRTKTRPCFTAALNESKNPKFLAINHSTISFDREDYRGNKKIATRFTIIRPLAAGWGGAPYKQGQKSTGSKKLSELVRPPPLNLSSSSPAAAASGDVVGGAPSSSSSSTTTPTTTTTMRLYSFEKVPNNMEKGPRCDAVSFEITAGNTFKFWLDEKRLDDQSMKRAIGGLINIKAMTLCEIHMASKNTEGVAKGTGCKITEVHPCPFTLHSCLADVERFPTSLAEARAVQLRVQQDRPHIANDLVPEEAAFHLMVSPRAFLLEEEPGTEDVIRLANTGANDTVDILESVLLDYTNSVDRSRACSLLEMAIANGALQLLVLNCDYWKNATHSSLRAIPLINTELLLQSVVPSLLGTQSDFITPSTFTVEDTTYNIQIHIDPEPTPIATGAPPKAIDFVLTDRAVELERAYKLRFNLVAHEHEIPNFWVGYYDASSARCAAIMSAAGGGAPKRRKPTPCGASDAES